VSNAAVEFDVTTLRPTYRLTIGLPGKSQAFAIAERLGLPGDILADARVRISAEHATMEEMLAAITRAERAQAAALEAAEAERSAAAEERELATGGVARARREAAEMLAEARRSADELVARAEREVADLRRELTRQRNLAGGRRGVSTAAFDEMQRRAGRVRSDAAPVTPDPAESGPADPTGPQPRPGLFGRSRTLGSTGRIVEVSGRTGRVTLETEGARLVVPADDVEVVPEPISGPTPRDLEAEEMRRRAAQRVSPSIDLHGERVEAALERLHAYLDDALLAGLDQVVIVHGIGTGALRRAVRESLAEHPRVRAVRGGRKDEGGEGATVAEL
jgi:DNA mismatch repair protein MutS2